MGWWGDFRPYVPVARRRAIGLREAQRLAGKSKQLLPVKIDGRAIATTFWGKAWCDNLESYSDFSNRLPRGRTYVRNGSVINLEIEPGKVTSLVCGSHLYRITIRIRSLAAPRWKAIGQQCGAQIGSVVELLQGRLSKNVMEIVTHRKNGLFPAPAEIEMSCSCPDWAGMCKHVAATLYGVGSRLDQDPALLFKLREVDHTDLINQAGRLASKPKGTGTKTIAKDQLADVFGIELEIDAATIHSAPPPPARPKREGKFIAVESSRNGQSESLKIRRDKTPASSRPSVPKGKTITAKQRKQIAEVQRKRWAALREKTVSKHENGYGNVTRLSRATARETAKQRRTESASGKSAHRATAV
jgi:uncharacterized Zn finger protein